MHPASEFSAKSKKKTYQKCILQQLQGLLHKTPSATGYQLSVKMMAEINISTANIEILTF